MPATSINLPSDVQGQVNSAAANFGVDPNVASAVAQVESGGDQSQVSPKGAIGVMQLEPSTFYGMGYTDINDQTQNINAGVQYLSQQIAANGGDVILGLAAYNAGPGNVAKYGGVPPFAETQAYVYNVAQLAQRAGSPNLSTSSTLQAGSTADSSPLVTPQGTGVAPDNAQAFQNSLTTNLQINTGLNVIPWFEDTGLVTGNPRIRQGILPVSFIVYLSQQTGQQLVNPTTQAPIELQLNCSMMTFELTSKHVFNRTPSRTGMHLTFWGMQPDLIVGTASTGVFMNQFGLTDFFSTALINDDIAKLVTGGGSSQTANSVINSLNLNNPNEAFRVAAQDAFVEFLKLFQMNGNVWFYNANFTVDQSNQQQTTPSGWSSQTGTSTAEKNARNNDVHSRGYVAMRFKNSVYLGYFKSLTWTMDAGKPFSWNFNFAFQVEHTYTSMYYAQAGGGS